MKEDKMKQLVEAAAQAAHEANRSWCSLHGDNTQRPWFAAPGWQCESARMGVVGVIKGNTPRESHELWLTAKQAEGWKYGPVKDVENKEHPCFVEYDMLPPEQQAKDAIFVAVVRAFVRAYIHAHPGELPEIERTFKADESAD